MSPLSKTNPNIVSHQDSLLHGTHIDIYGDDYSSEIHAGKYFIHMYNELCYTYMINVNIDIRAFIGLIEAEYQIKPSDYLLKVEQSHHDRIHKKDDSASQFLVKLMDKVLMEVHSHRIAFWYGTEISQDFINKIIPLIKKCRKRKIHNCRFYMIAASQHSDMGFYLQEYDLKRTKVNIEENYNEDFAKTHRVIENFLRKDDANGVVLLHGKFGTGKTTYLRHLIASVNKRFIFLPLDLMDAISSPSFLPFISEYRNSILILEDCEHLLTPRENNMFGHSGLVNLLNMGDGLLSDALSLKLICTFNAEVKKIDQAILRKGRLVARYEFKELEVPKVQKIYEKLGIMEKADKEQTLAEIYNNDKEDYGEVHNQPKRTKIGFSKEDKKS